MAGLGKVEQTNPKGKPMKNIDFDQRRREADREIHAIRLREMEARLEERQTQTTR